MSGFREGFVTNRRISLASFDIPTAYPAEAIRLRVTYGNVKLAPPWNPRTPRSFAPTRERCGRTNLGAKDFPCKEFSVSPMVWMLTAIHGALLRQRFIAVLMLLL